MKSRRLGYINEFSKSGFCLIPLRGKVPAVKDWRKVKPGHFKAEELAKGNYGISLGNTDLVVDVDPRRFPSARDVWKEFIERVGNWETTYAVKTGGGGLHIYFKKPGEIKIVNELKEFPGIEFKSSGRQVVGPGSIHPETKKEYYAVGAVLDSRIAAPASLLSLIAKPAQRDGEKAGVPQHLDTPSNRSRFSSYLSSAAPAIQGNGGDAHTFKVAAKGRDLGLSEEATLELMEKEWNDKCVPPWSKEELRTKVRNAYKFSSGALGAEHPAAVFSSLVEKSKKVKPEVDWDLTSQGGMKKSFKNLINFLRSSKHRLQGVFVYNDFTGRVEFGAPAPWHNGSMPRAHGVGDNDLKLLKGYLATEFKFEQAIGNIEEATLIVSHDSPIHPVREYLEGLKWDGKKRLDNWLRDYCGAEDSEYVRACARKTLCAAVLRVFYPGIKFDHVLTLEGSQGIGKSSVVKILGGKWSGDSPIDTHDRDTIQYLQGHWIVEMAEIECFRKSDEDALKAFLTRTEDKARLAYGRTVAEFPRQFIFISTKNPGSDGRYLRDQTGNRRWWPVSCRPISNGMFDLKGLKAVRDQLFAEAVELIKSGKEELYMDTPELARLAKEAVDKRRIDPEWTERIAQWVHENPERVFVTTREVFIEALGGTDKQLDRRSSTNISLALKRLGWDAGQQRINGRVTSGYSRLPATASKLNGTAKGVTGAKELDELLGV